MTFDEVLANFRQTSFTERNKGTRFERLIAAWFRTDPLYILDLLLSVINVSVQTVDIVNALPVVKVKNS